MQLNKKDYFKCVVDLAKVRKGLVLYFSDDTPTAARLHVVHDSEPPGPSTVTVHFNKPIGTLTKLKTLVLDRGGGSSVIDLERIPGQDIRVSANVVRGRGDGAISAVPRETLEDNGWLFGTRP